MKLLYTIIATLVVLFIITFSLANTTEVPIRYYGFIDVSVETYLLIFISFGVGIILAGFMGCASASSTMRPRYMTAMRCDRYPITERS